MEKVSIIIPSRNEELLANTVDDIFNNATGDFEVIVCLDGHSEYKLPKERERLIIVNHNIPIGMRSMINNGVMKAKGKYIMKCDSHCAFSRGFDEVLKKDCEKDWVVMGRRYELISKTWSRRMDRMPIDYFYFSCPWTSPNYFFLRVCPWVGRTKDRKHILIDETLTLNGSMWFMHKEHFDNRLGGLDSADYGEFGAEQQEIGNKTWLGGGKVMVNKNVWYAHFNKAHITRNYPFHYNQIRDTFTYSAEYWVGDKWKERKHDFAWLIDRFWPLPTANSRCNGEKYVWDENWKEYYK